MGTAVILKLEKNKKFNPVRAVIAQIFGHNNSNFVLGEIL
jgi:hypothetical protein